MRHLRFAIVGLAAVIGMLSAGLAVAAASTPARSGRHHVAPGALAQRSNVPGLSAAAYANAFVTRRGARLYVAGRPFRFAGANAENLGLRNYGPIPSKGQPYNDERYATRYEIDDEMATLHEMGATAVRVQTLGDSVGCSRCLEPTLGHFNPRAFHELDLVVAAARQYGIKLIGEFAGDANDTEPYGTPGADALAGTESTDWYCVWNGVSKAACPTATFEDPTILHDYEAHMRAVLDHVNPYTGLAYKNDPTFLGWVDGNNLGLLNPTPLASLDSWLTQVSSDFHAIDHHQLFIDISFPGGDYVPPTDTDGLTPDYGATSSPATLSIPGIDIYGQEWYPKDFPAVDPGSGAAAQLHANAAAAAGAGKAFAAIEFGWDKYNMTTTAVLRSFLDGIAADRHISGELYWDLLGHSSGHGWEAVPADEHCTPTCAGPFVEDGSWWAMYDTGVTTASNTAAAMAQRAQILRAGAYRLDGFARVPAHEIPPAPIITSTRGGRVLFEGSAGARDYSVQVRAGGRWITRCRGCTTDADDGWRNRAVAGGCVRVIAYNLANRPSAPSAPAGSGCRRRRG